MIQEKPTSLSVTDFIIRRLGVKLMMDEELIGKIVSFQGEHANKATQTNNQIEFSGFGKFIFYEKGAKKRLEKDLDKKQKLEVANTGKDKDKAALTILNNRINYIESKVE